MTGGTLTDNGYPKLKDAAAQDLWAELFRKAPNQSWQLQGEEYNNYGNKHMFVFQAVRQGSESSHDSHVLEIRQQHLQGVAPAQAPNNDEWIPF